MTKIESKLTRSALPFPLPLSSPSPRFRIIGLAIAYSVLAWDGPNNCPSSVSLTFASCSLDFSNSLRSPTTFSPSAHSELKLTFHPSLLPFLLNRVSSQLDAKEGQ